MRIVCTICSRKKDKTGGYLPARARYTGEHVPKAHSMARALGLPLYFVSAEFGLVHEGKLIPYYNHPLRPGEVEWVAEMVKAELSERRVKEIEFCAEPKPSWAPYRDALERAARALGISVTVRFIAA